MHARRIALVGIVMVAVLLSGCHRLGLVKSPAKPKSAAVSAAASGTASPSGAAGEIAGTSIAVQNGGGIKGRGAAMVSRLKALGFRPGSATNAKVSNHTTTVIYYKPGHHGEAARVRQALGLGTIQPATADMVLSTDVLVIVGKDF